MCVQIDFFVLVIVIGQFVVCVVFVYLFVVVGCVVIGEWEMWCVVVECFVYCDVFGVECVCYVVD